MPDPEKQLAPATFAWKTRVVVMGGMLGAVLGLLSAYMYLKSSEQAHGPDKAPPAPDTRDAVKIGVALLAIIRAISGWGKRE